MSNGKVGAAAFTLSTSLFTCTGRIDCWSSQAQGLGRTDLKRFLLKEGGSGYRCEGVASSGHGINATAWAGGRLKADR